MRNIPAEKLNIRLVRFYGLRPFQFHRERLNHEKETVVEFRSSDTHSARCTGLRSLFGDIRQSSSGADDGPGNGNVSGLSE